MEDSSLTKSDCFLFGNIYNLSRLNGYFFFFFIYNLIILNDYCFATNKVLSILSFVKIRTINYSLKRLENKGYIRIERVKNNDLTQRRIYIEDMKIDSS